ncbi:MAG: Universal stress protein UspA and related nucleotide-binding proteins [uncultured Lysobacter sp.]|uniref:Universal stress protein UspA and related nucleotide-binding proteins n=1 Tax=uncultured Lysobacter sp. TaxID=271060 RepID=A0A6J4KSC7_9GAMM|nr:MAG: Universal stress protein UspA and related nucleotide-binding proteins [uncultured Lysobacter sp.]
MNESALIHADGCVLAAVDASAYATSVADYAGWAAARLSAPLELLRTLEKGVSAPVVDLSGNIALGTQEALLAELAELDARRMTLAQEQGRALLDGLRRRLAEEQGVSAEVRQRHGGPVEALLDLEPGVRLFVIGKRGEHADFARGHLGSNLERVLRAVHRPVLVAAREFSVPTRFVIAFDGSATTRRCVEMVCASPLLAGLACHVVTAGDPTPALQGHLDWARDRLRVAGFAADIHVEQGDAETVIARRVESLHADLLVAGAYGHSRIRSMILGSTTTQLLRQCQVPVLLLR